MYICVDLQKMISYLVNFENHCISSGPSVRR